MKRRDFLTTGLATTIGGGIAASTLAAPAIASGTEKWKLVTSWPKGAPGVGTGAQTVVDYINAMSGGRIEIKLYGAGEIVPPFEVMSAVENGVVEMAHTTPYFAVSKNRVLNFFTTIPFGMMEREFEAWITFGDGQALWDEAYAQFGLKSFYSGSSGIQSAGWFQKEIKSLDDMKGLNMRIAGLGADILRELGVNTILMPPGEIFTSLQAGAIDAAEWVGPWNDMGFGLDRIAKHYYLPAFHEPSAALETLINKDRYEALPADLQQIIQMACKAASATTSSQFAYYNILSLPELAAKEGITINPLPDDVIAACHKVLPDVMTKLKDSSPLATKTYNSYVEFTKKCINYSNQFQSVALAQRQKAWG